ncbi:bis-aminopropyl spermidine synthase family protein [Geoglobus acetivorans]|uniref:N(4)-bis(aminopropyl)spermidine synthase n=1 Tax=Geoglobus acetivorans TaxID=565033 RepID=A0ABZ3H4L8_GEOAI|nr:bis-aminopropyl spermidine synthase family protein [Geoglobus acetivorans]
MMRRIRNQILQALSSGPVSVYRLIDMQDASLPEFFQLVDELINEDIIRIENGNVIPTEKARRLINELGAINLDTRCKSCEGTGYVISKDFEEILKKYKEIAEKRPETVEVFDQGFISPEGVIRRVEFIYERGDLLRSRIFVVGDDDLLSIAAALTGMPEKISVIDADERLIDFINRTAEEYGLCVEAETCDVQNELPDKFRGKYDVFVTDPVETIPGLKLFLSRGVSALKGEGCSGYFGITTLEASRKKWYEIQRMIYDMGFVITDLRRKFNVYPDEEKNFFRFQDKLPVVQKFGARIDHNFYTSTLFRIEAVKKPEPLVKGRMVINEAVYKDDESWMTPY